MSTSEKQRFLGLGHTVTHMRTYHLVLNIISFCSAAYVGGRGADEHAGPEHSEETGAGTTRRGSCLMKY
jgi:hypothetical protein